MAEASAFSGAAKSIASALVTEAKYLCGVEGQLRALQRDLLCMQQFLQDVDANPNRLKQDGQLRILTLEMRQLAFRAEDAVDTYLVEVGSKINNKNFLLKFVCLASHAYPVHMLRKEIDAIQQEAKAAMTRSQEFRTSIPTTSQMQGACVGPSYSKPAVENYIHLDEFVVGIEDDIKRLVNRLIDMHDDFQVLGIVGTGGAGKTTLASQIYRHTIVQSSFPYRTFVSISQKWTKLDLLHHIAKEVLGDSRISSCEWELVRELHAFMKDKRCLVVLDDIWKKEAWIDISPIFPRSQGLKVILTTRKEEVPRYADKKCVLHEPQMLTNDQMWALLSKGAVEGRHGIENNDEFGKLGKLMLQKCHGLPLAVVTLAGILRTKQHLYEWERVSVALSNNILEGKGGFTSGVVEEILELSFLDLPAHWRPLFLYLAITLEDFEWFSEDLIAFWIAEGFIADDQIGGSETLEDIGMLFISELAQRYIIRVKTRNYRDEVESFYLHDLMRDFCIKKASECQFLEIISFTCPRKRPNKPRRVSILSREHYPEENKYLRTLVYSLSNQPINRLIRLIKNQTDKESGVIKNLESIHENFKLLRILIFTDCTNKTLPKKIGNLIHLTYLSVVRTYIMELPQSVKNLRNLMYLVFRPLLEEGETAKVPDDLVVNMVNLRVLELPSRLWKRGSNSCNSLGLSSERHKKLHTFKCSAGRWMTKDLPIIHQLITLRDIQFTNIEEAQEMEAIIQCLGFLKSNLQTFFCDFFGKELKFDTEKLVGFQSLRFLWLHGPLVTNQFPTNLVRLHISKSEIEEGIDLMEALGQLSELKYLYIGFNAKLGKQLSCMEKSFPRLEELMLERLDNLEEWRVERGAMHRLIRIDILGCPKLKRLPQEIESITTLKELKIAGMPEEFCWRLGYKIENGGAVRTREGEDSSIIEHIPSIKLHEIYSITDLESE